MAVVTNDNITANMEILSKNFPELYEKAESGTAYDEIKKAAEDVLISKTESGKDFRLNFEYQPPGTFGTFNEEGGSLGVGDGTKSTQMYQSYFNMKLAIGITLGAISNTKSAQQSIKNQWKNNLQKAIPNFKRYCATGFHQMGAGNQGLVALGSAVTAPSSGSVTFTFDSENGANLLIEGQRVEIFSNDLGTHRTTGLTDSTLPYVASLNKEANQGVISGLGSITPSADDYLAFPGVGATPAWATGMRYFNRTATSGTMLGVNVATYPALLPNKYNAGGALTPMMGYLLKTRIRQRAGTMPGNLLGVIHDAQVAQILSTQIAISEFSRGSSDKSIDLLPAVDDKYIQWCGVKHLKDIHASKKRVDWLDKSTWYRVYKQELDYYKNPVSGQWVFEGRNSSGEVTANFHYFLWLSENFANSNPMKGGFIYGLAIPSDF
jgi:hypothetical protein